MNIETMRNPKTKLGLGAAYLLTVLVSATTPLHAQVIEQGRYQERLLELSEVLGSLHHLRGSCVSSESQIWRENMMTLIRLEAPSNDRKNAMVAQFNKGYGTARRRYPECTRETAREAERLASQGAEISDAISLAVNS